MLLNKRKRNPGQNLTNNWVRFNNVCEPAPKTMFCPPPPPSSRGIQRTPEVCFDLANRQRLFNWAIIAPAQIRIHSSSQTIFGAASQTNLTRGLISSVAQVMYCGLASIPGSGDAISLISNVTFANQLRYRGSGSPTDSTELPEVFFEFPSNPIGKFVIRVKAFLTGQSWQVNKSRGTRLEHNKHSALSHRPRGH